MIANLRLRNSRRELALLVGGFAVLLLATSLWLVPRVRAVTRLAREAGAAQAQADQLAAELAPYAPLLAAGGERGPARLFGGDSAESVVPALLDRLAALGNDCALTVTAMSPETTAPRPLPNVPGAPADAAASARRAVRVLTITIEAEADFLGLGRYLEALAGLDVPLAVLSLEIEPAGRGGAERVAARFTLGTWVLDETGSGPEARDEAA